MLYWNGIDHSMKMDESPREQNKKSTDNNDQNKGNQIGAGPAAQRYTEARLSKLTEFGMLDGIKKNAEFMLNYSDTLEEPVSLPSIFPNLLCNPNIGIGVSLSTSWAPHNLREVAQAINDYLDGKEPMLPGPDFPTGGVVINKDDIPDIMRTGHGTVKVRGKYKVDKNKITFYELPYGTTLEALKQDIADACDAEKVIGISRVYDVKTSLIIETKKAADPRVVIEQLFAHTNLQTSFSYNQVALIDKTPTELTLKDAIKIYVDHNITCIKRGARTDLSKLNARIHIVNGLLKCLESIDEAISIIKKANDAVQAKEDLMARFKIDEVQAEGVLNMKLARLAKIEKLALEEERDKISKDISELTELLQNRDKQLNYLRGKLNKIADKFGDDRRTELTQIELPKSTTTKGGPRIKPEIPKVDCVVAIGPDGQMKRTAASTFKAQRRNTKGIANKEEVRHVIKTNTHEDLLVFSSCGKMYKVKVNDIPDKRNIDVSDFVTFTKKNERPMAFTALGSEDNADDSYVFFLTEKGLIKKVLLSEFKVKRSTGIRATKIDDDDKLIAVYVGNDSELLVYTEKGYVVRMYTGELKPASKLSKGVKSINLSSEDKVIGCCPMMSKKYVAAFSENCYGKLIPQEDFVLQGRATKGMVISGPPITLLNLDKEDEILVSGDVSTVRMKASELPEFTRSARGNMVTKGNNKINSVVRV